MAYPHATHLPTHGTARGTSVRRHSQIVKRRRVLLLAMACLLLVMATAANCGPLRAYSDARARLASATAGIAELSAQKADLQVELGRLSESEYLESLARQDLSYTRPGEELYIVSGTGNVSHEGPAQSGVAPLGGSPGFVERVLAPILD